MNRPAQVTTAQLASSRLCGGLDGGAGDLRPWLAPMCQALGLDSEHLPSLQHSHTLCCGELLNRAQMQGWLGLAGQPHTDGELLTRAFLAWGEVTTLNRISGKFALAHWNAERQRLVLACDRTTQFTVFYGRLAGHWLFSSDFGAFRPLHRQLEVDRQTLALFVRYGFVPAPHSFYRQVRKLRPGHWVALSVHDCGEVEQQPYAPSSWAYLPTTQRKPIETGLATATFEHHLLAAIEARLDGSTAGAFMSSGFDSTLGAALLQKALGKPIHTFTAGFQGMHCNEAPDAAAIARHLGTLHHEIRLDDAALAGVVPDIPNAYGEPLADSSQLPSMLLARAASEYVDTVFAGDGADCVLGEYAQRLEMYRSVLRTRSLPAWTRTALGRGLVLAGRCSTPLGTGLARWIGRRLALDDPGRDAVEDVRGVLAAGGLGQVERVLGARVLDPARLVPGGPWQDVPWPGSGAEPPRLSVLLDQLVQVQGEILIAPVTHKTLGACDHAGLRVAMPFLDGALLDFARGLPHRLKHRRDTSKWLLRQVAYQYIPRALLERKKLGFSIWVSPLLRDYMRDWAEHLLAPGRLRDEGFFDVAQVRWEWTRLLYHGEHFREERLWSVLMFQQWLDTSRAYSVRGNT
ncbi:asparagine synthetase B family protein [Pseudomonas entomophila]|uniref:asparagine synthetase B family protein n=1 Tax=Pseudomonas entomophila TaxID=312306 RepID=UPI00200C538C|nr:asparagine synthase C-terminal domain-containing protein [Pseudomonas entomophila]